jgi:hypothetical protein
MSADRVAEERVDRAGGRLVGVGYPLPPGEVSSLFIPEIAEVRSRLALTRTQRHNTIPPPMMLRVLVILTLCFAIFSGSVLGLSNGMVLVVHDDGHLGIEHALTRHAHEHGDGADHESHDYTPDAEHGALHAAIVADTDSCPPRPAQEPAGHTGKHSIDLPALWTALLLSGPSLPSAASSFVRSEDARGSIAPTENARLRTVVLVI